MYSNFIEKSSFLEIKTTANGNNWANREIRLLQYVNVEKQ